MLLTLAFKLDAIHGKIKTDTRKHGLYEFAGKVEVHPTTGHEGPREGA
jgi:hypothetical protein